MDNKKIVLAIIACITFIIVPIANNVISDYISDSILNQETSPPPLLEQDLSDETISPPIETFTDISNTIKQLQSSAINVTFWLNSPFDTQFKAEDEITLYYKINDKSQFAYFSLFNISPTGELHLIISNEKIETGRMYSLPKTEFYLQAGEPLIEMDKRLSLEKGQEYFKAIVSSERIKWQGFIAKNLENVTWGTQDLTVQVK